MQTQHCDLQQSILGELNVMDFTMKIMSLDSERGALVHVREVQRPKPESALDCTRIQAMTPLSKRERRTLISLLAAQGPFLKDYPNPSENPNPLLGRTTLTAMS